MPRRPPPSPDPPRSLPFAPRHGPAEPDHGQPLPLVTMVGRVAVGHGSATSVTRLWAPADVPLCRLCPPGRCCAVRGVCNIIFGWHVPSAEAALFRRPDEVGPRLARLDATADSLNDLHTKRPD